MGSVPALVPQRSGTLALRRSAHAVNKADVVSELMVVMSVVAG